MKTYKYLILFGITVSLLSCSILEKPASGRKAKFSVQAGTNLGGITENTDMSVVPGVKVPAEATVDAFSGATRLGFNAGVHLSQPLKNNQIEAGLDYMYNSQEFNYIDAGNRYIGVRELNVSQLMFPVSYNFVLLKKWMPNAELQLKAGIIGQANFISTKGTGLLPDYSVNPFSAGPTLGFSFLPVNFKNGDKLGLYGEIYRGSQIYKDFYNQPDFEMPGSSFIKFGLKYQFH